MSKSYWVTSSVCGPPPPSQPTRWKPQKTKENQMSGKCKLYIEYVNYKKIKWFE